jgi:hypothetical protein
VRNTGDDGIFTDDWSARKTYRGDGVDGKATGISSSLMIGKIN